MTRLLVLYGHPKDPVAFDKYYQESHIPIARRMKGLKKWMVGKVQPTPDGKPSLFYNVADLYMDSTAKNLPPGRSVALALAPGKGDRHNRFAHSRRNPSFRSSTRFRAWMTGRNK